MASPLDWISGIGNAISGFVAPIVSWYTNKKTNETNKENVDNTNQTNLDIATNTNETNKAIADENLQYQKDLFEYNKALQEEVFNREDTAYQRTKLDMLAAGLNPLSMQGTNGAGEIIPQTAPQNNFQAQQSAPMQAPINQESNLANTMLSAANQLFTSIQDLQTGSLSRDKLRQEIKWNDIEKTLNNIGKGITLGKDGKLYFDDDVYDTYVEAKRKGYLSDLSNYNDIIRENKHKEDAGLYNTDTKVERAITAITDWLTSGRSEEMWNKLKNKYPLLQLLDDYAKQLFAKEEIPGIGTDYDYYEDMTFVSSGKTTRKVYKDGKLIKEYEFKK